MDAVPVTVPPVSVRLCTVTSVVNVTVPLAMTASSLAPGTMAHDHFVLSFQLPLEPFQVQATAPAVVGARSANTTALMTHRENMKKNERVCMRISSSSCDDLSWIIIMHTWAQPCNLLLATCYLLLALCSTSRAMRSALTIKILRAMKLVSASARAFKLALFIRNARAATLTSYAPSMTKSIKCNAS